MVLIVAGLRGPNSKGGARKGGGNGENKGRWMEQEGQPPLSHIPGSAPDKLVAMIRVNKLRYHLANGWCDKHVVGGGVVCVWNMMAEIYIRKITVNRKIALHLKQFTEYFWQVYRPSP